jgi:hypothetical protein
VRGLQDCVVHVSAKRVENKLRKAFVNGNKLPLQSDGASLLPDPNMVSLVEVGSRIQDGASDVLSLRHAAAGGAMLLIVFAGITLFMAHGEHQSHEGGPGLVKHGSGHFRRDPEGWNVYEGRSRHEEADEEEAPDDAHPASPVTPRLDGLDEDGFPIKK